MSTQDRKRKRISREAMEERRPLSPDVLVDGDSEHAHQDPGPVRAARTPRGKRRDEARIPSMVWIVPNSPKDDHLPSMARLLIDLTDIKDARALAKRWAVVVRGAKAAGPVTDISTREIERLLAWVLEYAREAIDEGMGADDVAANLAIELDLGDGDAFDERAARDLLRAAGWPS